MRLAYYGLTRDPDLKELKEICNIDSIQLSGDGTKLVCNCGNVYHSVPLTDLWIIIDDRRLKKHG